MNRRFWYHENPTHSVYALVDPETSEPRYVGVSRDPEKRLQQHLVNKRDREKYEWLQSLRQRGLKPNLVILEQITEDVAFIRESIWIHAIIKAGYPLFNFQAKPPPEPRYVYSDDAIEVR